VLVDRSSARPKGTPGNAVPGVPWQRSEEGLSRLLHDSPDCRGTSYQCEVGRGRTEGVAERWCRRWCSVPAHRGRHVARHCGHPGSWVAAMELARYVVDAVVLEGRGVREVARSHGVSKSWVSVQLARPRLGGGSAGTHEVPTPRRCPSRCPPGGRDDASPEPPTATIRLRAGVSVRGRSAERRSDLVPAPRRCPPGRS
jgi:hypothetical protein